MPCHHTQDGPIPCHDTCRQLYVGSILLPLTEKASKGSEREHSTIHMCVWKKSCDMWAVPRKLRKAWEIKHIVMIVLHTVYTVQKQHQRKRQPSCTCWCQQSNSACSRCIGHAWPGCAGCLLLCISRRLEHLGCSRQFLTGAITLCACNKG